MPPITPPSCPPGIPPGTPPTTPPVEGIGGGASSSLIICTFCGIRVGVRSAPLESRSLWICYMILATCCSAAGGGGGGGGGATRKVSSCDLGSCSVKYSGNNSRIPSMKHCNKNERRVAHVCCFF